MIWRVRHQELDLSKKGRIMGILNITPDSFSDGGDFLKIDTAVNHALRMIQEGAEIIDIGGESTRPGSLPVSTAEELKRTIPVIQALRKKTQALISIDTSKPEVASQAIEAGVDIVNDVTGLSNPAMIEACASSNVGLVCMHMQGTPENMQDQPVYSDVIQEIQLFFTQQLERLTASGIALERICFDPGVGFGKTLEDNLQILREIKALRVSNRPLLMGISRKSFISKITEDDDIDSREAPTVGLTSYLANQGVNIHRVHDVLSNTQALRMTEAIRDIT